MRLTLETLPLWTEQVGECMIWQGSVGSHGYPQARLGGATRLVRSYVYYELLGNQRRPAYPRIVAKCGNPMCVSPACLRSWSSSQVIAASYKSGSRSGPGEYIKRMNRSIRNGQAKLSPEKAAEIRQLPASMTHTEIGLMYGVHNKTISRLRRGETWRTELAGSSVFSFARTLR